MAATTKQKEKRLVAALMMMILQKNKMNKKNKNKNNSKNKNKKRMMEKTRQTIFLMQVRMKHKWLRTTESLKGHATYSTFRKR